MKSILSIYLDVYEKKGIDILVAKSPIDPYLMQFLERKLAPAHFQRLDASLDEHLVDKEREKTILDASGQDRSRQARRLRPLKVQ